MTCVICVLHFCCVLCGSVLSFVCPVLCCELCALYHVVCCIMSVKLLCIDIEARVPFGTLWGMS